MSGRILQYIVGRPESDTAMTTDFALGIVALQNLTSLRVRIICMRKEVQPLSSIIHQSAKIHSG